MISRLGCRMHAMLRHFVYSAQRGLLVRPIKMIQWPGAFSDGITMLNRFLNISLRQKHCFAQSASGGKLRSNRGSESAARAMRVVRFYLVAAKREHFCTVEKNVHWFFHVAA